MPYPRNTRHWEVGKLVIHAGDAKKIYMLMRVTGYSRSTGLCQTVYVYDNTYPGMTGTFDNELGCLLNPEDFGLPTTVKPLKKISSSQEVKNG